MERLEDDALNIYTDGSQKERPRRGGYAFLFVVTGEDGQEVVYEFSPNGEPGANSQEMEIRAVAEALKLAASPRSPVELSRFRKIVIHTDSLNVRNGFGSAKFDWSKSQWMRRSGPPVMHAEIWREILTVLRRIRMPVHVEWVKGKSNRHTKLVDKLAKDSAERPFARPSRPRTVRRKRTEKSVEPGSVTAEGQELEIQLITVEWLSVQRCLRYKYEVVSEESPYFGNVDYVFSDEPLETRWVWRVRLNDEPAHPQIKEVLERVRSAERSSEDLAEAD